MGRGHGTCCKRIIASVLGAAIIATIVAVCVVYIPKNMHKDKDDTNPTVPKEAPIDDGPRVTNKEAFRNGGASSHPADNDDGKDDAKDQYIYYPGNVTNYPKDDDWVSFDFMWKANLPSIRTACKDHGWGDNNSDDENDIIHDQIQYVAKASLVDHRFILAVIMQESKGCLRVISTDSVHGVHNPGLMQSHNGSSFNDKDVEKSIRQMIKDGTQGTKSGDGLVQLLDKFPDAYSAARGYNSGDVVKSGDLSDAIGATPCYSSDVANRLMGWVDADSDCEQKVANVPQSSGTDAQSQSDGTSQQQQPSSTQWEQPAQQSSSSQQQSTSDSQQQSSSSTSSSSTFSDGTNGGTYSGGHWDTSGNYVKNGKRNRMWRA